MTPERWMFRPWCRLPCTFAMGSREEVEERRLHEYHQCTGRDFVAESEWHLREIRLREKIRECEILSTYEDRFCKKTGNDVCRN